MKTKTKTILLTATLIFSTITVADLYLNTTNQINDPRVRAAFIADDQDSIANNAFNCQDSHNPDVAIPCDEEYTPSDPGPKQQLDLPKQGQ